MTTNTNTLPGEPVTEWTPNIKVAAFGNEGTGKTTLGVRFARMRPDKSVIIFNTEPYENLDAVLKGYPEVRDRARIIPTKEQSDQIKIQGEIYDKTYRHGHEIALAEFLLEEVRDLCALPYDQISKMFIIFDTASFVYKHLSHKIMDDIKAGRIKQSIARFAYSDPKRKFNILAKRLMNAPTDVVMLARTDPTGRVTQKGGFEYDGGERPEWDPHKTRSKIWYEATTIIHLNKMEVKITDENNSYVEVDPVRLPGVYQTETMWWAKVIKHKTKLKELPVFWYPTPEKIFLWLHENAL